MKNRIGAVECHLGSGSLDGLFDDALALGLDEIEWFCCTDFEERHGPDAFLRLRELHRQTGLRCSYHAPWTGAWDLAGQPSEELAREALRRMLTMCARVGAGSMTLHVGASPGVERDRTVRAAELRRVAGILRDATDEVLGVGVDICIENVPAAWGAGVLGTCTEDLADVLCDLDPRAFGLNLDVGHANLTAGGVQAFLSELGPRLTHTHLHDNGGEGDEHLAPGRGSVDWGATLAGLASVNYRGPLILEFPQRTGAYPEFIRKLRSHAA